MEKIVYTNSRGDSITIGQDPPYFLTEFDHGAPQGTMITTKAPGQDGKALEDQTLEERVPQITATIRCPEDQIDASRRRLFTVLNPKLSGNLAYTNDAGTWTIPCTIQGVPTIKARSGRHQQVLIQPFCADPYWRDTIETAKQLAKWVGDLRFPAGFPEAGMPFGHQAAALIVNAGNPGDVACGLRIEFTAGATVTNPYLLNVDTQERIGVDHALEAGEKLVITTDYGNESVMLVQGRTETDVFQYIDQASDFLQLAPGDNFLRYGADSGMDSLEMAVFYTPRYTEV